MKKAFVLLTALLMAVGSMCALTADEIVGKWETNNIKAPADPAMPMDQTLKLKYDFKADNSVKVEGELSMSLMLDKGVYVDVFVGLDLAGEFTVAGDSITVTPDASTINVKLNEDDIRTRGIDDETMAAQVQQGIYQQLALGLDGLKEGFEEPDVLNNVMVTGNKMVCNMSDQFVTLKRKKK